MSHAPADPGSCSPTPSPRTPPPPAPIHPPTILYPLMGIRCGCSACERCGVCLGQSSFLGTRCGSVGKRGGGVWVRVCTKLQALVYDVLPSTTAVFSYAIGSRKLSVNEQFFCSCSNGIGLLETTQIISDVCFTTDHVACARANKTKIV